MITCLGCLFVLMGCRIEGSDSSAPAAKARIESLDQEISKIQKQLDELHLKVMKHEVESEKYIKYEWGNYTEQIEQAEHDQQEIEHLQKQLDALKMQRDVIEKS